MEIYKEGANSIVLNGQSFHADSRGIINVPDDRMTDSVYERGFVSAKGQIEKLQREAAEVQEPIIIEMPVTAIKTAVKKITIAGDANASNT